MAAAGFCISHCNFFFLLLEVQTALRLKKLHLLSRGEKKKEEKNGIIRDGCNVHLITPRCCGASRRRSCDKKHITGGRRR